MTEAWPGKTSLFIIFSLYQSQHMGEGGEGDMPKIEKEWNKGGLSPEAVFLVDSLISQGKLGTIVDCGAGEGRHSLYAASKGAEKVISIEKDSEQASVLKRKKEESGLANLEVIEGDVLDKLTTIGDGLVDGIIDCGMSHCLTEESQREQFVALVRSKLKTGGLYSITHFSEKEILSQDHFKTNLEGLKRLFPGENWEEVMSWQEASWKRADGQEHHAYKAVLRKK